MNADPPPKDCKVWHGGKMVRVSRAALEGIRLVQRHRAPDLDVILIAERHAALWLKMLVIEANATARRKAMAR